MWELSLVKLIEDDVDSSTGRSRAAERIVDHCALASYHATCEMVAKNKRVAMSDWSACPLSEEQVAYACTDAWLGFEFLDALLDRQPDAMQSRDALPGLSAFRAGYTTKPDDPAKTQAQGQAQTPLQIYA